MVSRCIAVPTMLPRRQQVLSPSTGAVTGGAAE
jgi:hypothetical protein